MVQNFTVILLLLLTNRVESINLCPRRALPIALLECFPSVAGQLTAVNNYAGSCASLKQFAVFSVQCGKPTIRYARWKKGVPEWNFWRRGTVPARDVRCLLRSGTTGKRMQQVSL